ncbi:MAG: response regulator [Acidobacteria bacterium]|nr:response regulator [Acidobacteriota bacterium]
MTPTILVVDDERNIRLLYEKELREEGWSVVLAADAREALKILEQSRPDLVVLDIKMPGMDGIEALSRILARDNGIPVVLNSAYSSYQESFLSWSADAYVIKSSDLTELKTKIRAILEERLKRP